MLRPTTFSILLFFIVKNLINYLVNLSEAGKLGEDINSAIQYYLVVVGISTILNAMFLFLPVWIALKSRYPILVFMILTACLIGDYLFCKVMANANDTTAFRYMLISLICLGAFFYRHIILKLEAPTGN